MAATRMKSAGNVELFIARLMVTLPSSSGWRRTSRVLRLNSGISSRNQTPLFAQADLAADSAWPASYHESASVRSFAGAAPSTGWVANDLPFRAEPASGIIRGRSPGRRQGGLRRDQRSDRDWGARWTMPEPTREKDKDKSAKWLIEHHGDAILRLGGVTDLVRWKAAPAELVLPTKLPDGLIFAWRAGRDRPEPHVVEIATYPELRATEQALRDLLLVYLIRGEVPNVLVLVLRPKGQLRIPYRAHRPGSDGVTELGGRWRVVELWTVPAEPVLATADPGMMPWVPLMQAADPPEVVLRRCREVIDHHAPAEEHDSLLTVTEVFTRLRYKDPNLLSILGGKTVMIESPLIREITAERSHKHILRALRTRFGPLPSELEAEVKSIFDETVLDAAIELAVSSPDLERFRAELRAIPRPPEPWDPADEREPTA